jgi:LytS/YehU family sensor histidine kinase
LLSYGIILGAYQMWSIVQQLREREMAASRLAVQLAQARLESLQNQLKPHFFFNAMNTVAMLVRAQNNTQAIRTLTGMSDLLRHVLAEDPPAVVPLKEELRFIERYLDIERIRFHDRLTISIDADEATLEALVPNLMLQPLVENAVRHGISAKAGARTIELTANLRDGNLLISVKDDGPGFSGGERSTRGSGVGLRNTRARLTEMYGDDARLELTDAPGGGAVVSIELPANIPVPSPVPIRV